MDAQRDPYAALVAGFERSPLLVGLFDAQDRLRWANQAYAATFLRGGLALPVAFADVLRHGFRGGFGVKIDCGDIEAFLAGILPRRRAQPERSLQSDTVDGRWLQFNETLLPDGWMLTVATDITALKQHERVLLAAARTDVLTGVANRRHVLELAEQAIVQGGGRATSLVLVDLDHFKQLNDSRGHAVGDQALQRFCIACRGQLRGEDTIGRVGGEEFLLVLPGVDVQGAHAIVERLRGACRLDPELPCTFSAGIASARRGEPLATLLRRADAALYAAKRNGRNRSELAEEAGLDPDRPSRWRDTGLG